ncbi:MAG: O-antigen ligase domain-containing protein [Bosea sp. (in: a-proteobacteria)]|uniref:O-antigen ligase family protein n=1 Tax=Bosea sp. (in: a-proteobacteria) TaxID=1871050 RepID=UPI002735A8EA|nr:O-antigen ligase family protein [Bosea sp. (in: a-proteobacteria)]MDP3602417.1 O-antigen ligase domain-containing protein [Bosea sp. (in: a-proteobacteria)]
MSALADRGHAEPARRGGLRISYAALKRGALWLLTASSGLALIEPSPYEVVFLLAVFVFMITGIRFSQKLLPLALLLLLYNIGGTFSLIPWMDESASVRFTAVSVYLMVTAVFLAAIMADDALGRLETLRRGYLFAAWGAGLAGLLGYFDVAGLGSVFTLYGRASGTFKDPNVLGPFLVLPIIYVLHHILTGRLGLMRGLLLMSVPLAALFLTFSRGAWGNLVAAALLMIALTFLTAPNAARRARVVALTLTAIGLLTVALLFALSFENIRSVFEVRASLDQSYDQGVTGRFGNQLRSIPLLLEEPNGFGPLRFRWLFPEDPHNVYINAFASYGWLGGFSWLALMAATCLVGWRLVFQRSPWQNHAIVLWSVLFVTILQGLQIDTDHWRHMYLMLGLVWGLAALPAPPAAQPQPRSLRTTT